MKNNKTKFLNFLESIKTKENTNLLESIITGFVILTESSDEEDKDVMTGIYGIYKGILVDVSVIIRNVEVTSTPEMYGSRDSYGAPEEPDEGGLELENYAATALIQPLNPEDYEPTDESPVSMNDEMFSEVKIPKFPKATMFQYKYNQTETTLDKLVTDYVESNLEHWA